MVLSTAMICLALNIYHEARSEPLNGQIAVAQVTMNRAGRDPDKICEVVFKPKQFSWANPLTTVSSAERIRRAGAFMPKEKSAWSVARQIAYFTVEGYIPDITGGADHYHRHDVKPIWRHALTKLHLADVGKHIFYRSS